MTWISEASQPIKFESNKHFLEALTVRLSESIMQEKKRAYGIDHLLFEEQERKQAIELVQVLIKQFGVEYESESGRVKVSWGGLEEDVAEWLVEVVCGMLSQQG